MTKEAAIAKIKAILNERTNGDAFSIEVLAEEIYKKVVLEAVESERDFWVATSAAGRTGFDC